MILDLIIQYFVIRINHHPNNILPHTDGVFYMSIADIFISIYFSIWILFIIDSRLVTRASFAFIAIIYGKYVHLQINIILLHIFVKVIFELNKIFGFLQLMQFSKLSFFKSSKSIYCIFIKKRTILLQT